MNTYKMEYDRQRKEQRERNEEYKMPTGVYIFAAIVLVLTVMSLLAMSARAETAMSETATAAAPAIIYQDESSMEAMNQRVTMVGIAPGVSVYVPDCDEFNVVNNGESSKQNNVDISRYQQDSLKVTQESTQAQHEYSSITISDAEMEELKRIVAAEAQTQSTEGREAVVEVIFNRVLSPEWPDTVHGVLCQKGQFATWRMQYQSWVVPDAAVAPIEYVLEHGRTVLPDTTYVYFDTRGVNGKGHIRIGAHYFGRQ